MLDFRSIEEAPQAFFDRFYHQKDLRSCITSLVCKKIWRFHASYAVAAGCLLIKNETEFMGTVFDFPRATEEGDLDAALDALDDYCQKNYTRLIFVGATDEQRAYLAVRYPHLTLDDDRTYRDYFYVRDDLATLTGKKYAGQRNHIHQFEKSYPNHEFRALNNSEKKAVLAFLEKWEKEELVKKDKNARREFAIVKAFCKEADFDTLRTGCVIVDGEICALCIGEKIDDQAIVHVEKALQRYHGINVFLVREFAKAQTDVRYLNREDDAGEVGLRTSKMQYHPALILREAYVVVRNELDGLKKIPVVHSERLTLNAIAKEDAEAYFRLCTDEERNRYWGYDYKRDLHEELTTDWFYRVAKRDFRARLGLNFAVRLDGAFIGETVIFEPDNKGACQIGVRILPEYAGHRYGEEAFEATIRFALYTLGMCKVYSSCYKDNVPSVKIHDRLFRKIGEDGDKFYYVREY